MSVQVRILKPGDAEVLQRVAADVFDHDVSEAWSEEFLDDPRHHLAVAISDGVVVGMASAVDYVHPDKPVEVWIQEVGVAPEHRRAGVASRLVEALLEIAAGLGCRSAWVATDPDNRVARALYERVGGRPEPAVLYTFDLAERHDS